MYIICIHRRSDNNQSFATHKDLQLMAVPRPTSSNMGPSQTWEAHCSSMVVYHGLTN